MGTAGRGMREQRVVGCGEGVGVFPEREGQLNGTPAKRLSLLAYTVYLRGFFSLRVGTPESLSSEFFLPACILLLCHLPCHITA